MQDQIIRDRIYEILAHKAMSEGAGYGGAVVGARRKRPSSFNMKVKAYMRKHGVSLPEAAHALRGHGEGAGEGGRKRRKRRSVHARRPAVRRHRRGHGEGIMGIGDGYLGYGYLGGVKKRSSVGTTSNLSASQITEKLAKANVQAAKLEQQLALKNAEDAAYLDPTTIKAELAKAENSYLTKFKSPKEYANWMKNWTQKPIKIPSEREYQREAYLKSLADADVKGYKKPYEANKKDFFLLKA
jgi:hypothetical protein